MFICQFKKYDLDGVGVVSQFKDNLILNSIQTKEFKYMQYKKSYAYFNLKKKHITQQEMFSASCL